MTLLLYGLSGTAMSQAATPSDRATTTKQHAVAGSTVSSSQPGNKPWVGCSASAGSTICRNVYNYKTYAECTQAGVRMGWGGTESYGYCSALALKE
jgi:hypothetical protein